MTSVAHLKGVRTGFRNVLERNISYGKDLLSYGLDSSVIEKNIFESSKCIKSFEIYCNKLKLQSEKLAAAIEESDHELLEQITEEDSQLCSEAIECSLDLQQYKDMLLSAKEKNEKKQSISETSEETRSAEFLELHKDMQKLMQTQIEQQEKLMESQMDKGKHSMKLPKLELISFGGDKTKWSEFWDSFKCSVHDNKMLSNSEKFNYLKSKLYGEAQRAVSGLTLSDITYDVAIGILRERFGNVQEVVDLHYSKLINLLPASNKTSSLRALLDTVEKHLHSLEVLEQNINQAVFVSMIRAKLPEDVLVQLEILNGSNNKWTIPTLRGRLRDYILAKERTEKKVREFDKVPGDSRPVQKGYKQNLASLQQSPKQYKGSAHVLTVNTCKSKSPPVRKPTENYADQCRFCQLKHWSDECTKYQTISERKQQLKDSCFKCLKVGLRSSVCNRGRMCTYCGEMNKHHRSLCPKKFRLKESMTQLVNEVSEYDQDTQIPEENVLVSSNEMVLMQTATTDIKNPNTSNNLSVRLLLDSGSHRTYITEKLASKLHLKETGEQEIKLVTFGSNSTQCIKTKCANIDVKLKNGEYISISVNIVPTISGHLHRSHVSVLEKEHMKHIVGSVDLADTLPTENESSSIEMLVGNDYYLDFVLCQIIQLHPGLFLLGSKLGWILTGRTSDRDNDGPCMLIMTQGNDITNGSLFANADSVLPIKPNLEDFWNLESIGIVDKHDISENEIAMKTFLDTIKFEDGRYQVTWPWAEEFPDLPVNRELAIGRLKSCVNNLKVNPELMTKYDAVMKDQLNKGVIEKVKGTSVDGLVHYLPHHAVISPQKTTTKLRVVYDASARTKKANKSLNECMYRVPVMLQDLCGMLLRFRMQSIAVVADIEKAFLQIALQPNQRDVTRFLWLKDCENPSVVNGNIQEFRFCRVPFGVISSPFLLGAVVDFHLKCYSDPVAEKLRNNIYVDNVITGAENTSEAIEMYTKSKSMFANASMNLREWVTNSDVVNEFIPNEDRTNTDTVKVLGHHWNVKKDTINITGPKIKSDTSEWTKRTVLKRVASVYDPLGLLSPVLLRGKILIQSLWQKNFDWDDELTAEDKETWSTILTDINQIETFQIPRCVCKLPGNQAKYTLLCFCDASGSAYATVIYIRVSHTNTSDTNVIFAKTRLAPVKKMTIPRLELLAVVIGLRCLKFVTEQIRVPIAKQFLWTDSKCVLQWITSKKKLSVFVRNRVDEIKEYKNVNLSYKPTKENPADVASRGATLKLLAADSSWWHGPKWLSKPSSDWPEYSANINDNSEKVSEEGQTKQEIKEETVLVLPESDKSSKKKPAV